MIKFSIFLPTYNRQILVVKTVESLLAQTYSNFEILLYDNGSHPSVMKTIEAYRDTRIKYTRYEENQNINDLAEDALDKMSGSYFLFLADDDVLVPSALEVAKDLLSKKEVDFLQVGFTHFNHIEQVCNLSKANLQLFTGKLDIFDSKEMAFHFINAWGIGTLKNYRAPRESHSSGIFISRELIERTRMRQGELFIKPFGDIGYVGALLNTDKCYYLDLPLAIIGETPVREMNGAKPGQRQKWNKEIKYLEHSPLKGASFVNMGADAHLKVLFRNHLNGNYDSRLRPDFYFRHLKQVLSDSPWTYITLKDIAESVPHALRSALGFFSIKYLLADKILVNIQNLFGINKQIVPPQNKKFEDINKFAAWIDENYVVALKKNQALDLG